MHLVTRRLWHIQFSAGRKSPIFLTPPTCIWRLCWGDLIAISGRYLVCQKLRSLDYHICHWLVGDRFIASKKYQCMTDGQLIARCVSSNRYRKTHQQFFCVVGPLLGERLDAFLRHTKRYGYCSENIATISDLFSAADESRFKRVLQNELYTRTTGYSRYYLLKPVSVTTYVFVTITDN